MSGRVPLPRLITAQADIVISKFLDPLLEVFRKQELYTLFYSRDAAKVHTAYVALCLLTEGCIWMFKDAERRNLQNSVQV
jgi:hypothetical protein